ncbi:MAG: D-alanine--D-alanine ligase [Deltaproteobacteria bacterium]|nr:D-alanine--D-alanine ligase [Deltaproteobacteria bacterium]
MNLTIGMTYDLRSDYLAEGYGEEETAEFDRPETIDALEAALNALGHSSDRIGHAKSLVKRLAAGDRWDIVFNIAEGLRGFGRESLIPALLDAYDIPYVFSDPLVLSLALHKGMTKHVIRDMGIPTPAFAVIERPEQIGTVNLPFPLFAKPVAEGTSKGISGASKITSPEALNAVCRGLLTQFSQPVLIETFLPGREFTVGIAGTGMNAEAVGIMEVHLLPQAEKDIYSYSNKENYKKLVRYSLPQDATAYEATEIALASWRELGCRDGGRVDLRSDAAGRPNFMEVNPLPGLHPENSDLPIICNLKGVSYETLIAKIMASAMRRLTR